MIAIIDYNMGNLRSVNKAFKRIGIDAKVTSNLKDIRSAERLVLPGVGHFERGMSELENLGLIDVIKEQVLNKSKPILGICLGMQLLTEFSEEGNVEGLKVVNAKTKKFELLSKGLKVPHIGWNTLEIDDNSRLLKNVSGDDFFYFVHTYYVTSDSKDLICSKSEYGHSIVSSFEIGNIFGVQFHPEKSHRQGLDLLQNFSNIDV
jgi:glutamine amidotransferase